MKAHYNVKMALPGSETENDVMIDGVVDMENPDVNFGTGVEECASTVGVATEDPEEFVNVNVNNQEIDFLLNQLEPEPAAKKRKEVVKV